MPSRTLSVMTSAPIARKSSATAISAVLRLSAARPPDSSDTDSSSKKMRGPAGPRRARLVLVAGDELRRLHQRDVARLFLRDPVGVFLALEAREVEGAVFHQLL